MQEITWISPALHKERSVDWFWAIGIITLLGAVAAFFFDNTIFAIFILLGGGLLFYSNLNKSDDTVVHITEKEITVNSLSYKTKNMKGFAITKSNREEDMLIVRTDRFFLPVLVLHIPETVSLDALDELLSARIERQDLTEPPANMIAERFGF